MKRRLATATIALVTVIATPMTSASAFSLLAAPNPHAYYMSNRGRDAPRTPDRPATVAPGRTGDCIPSPGAEGNANMQTQAVKSYGSVSGGSAC